MREILNLQDCELVTISAFYEIEGTIVSFVLKKKSSENSIRFFGFTDCVFYENYDREEFFNRLELEDVSSSEYGFYHLERSHFSAEIENVFNESELNAYALIFKERCYIVLATACNVEKQEDLPYAATYFNGQVSKHTDALSKDISIPKDRQYSWSRTIWINGSDSMIVAIRFTSKSAGVLHKVCVFKGCQNYLYTTIKHLEDQLNIDAYSNFYTNDFLIGQMGNRELVSRLLKADFTDKLYFVPLGNGAVLLLDADSYSVSSDIKVI